MRHELKLTPGIFIKGVQEKPWKCIHCGMPFSKRLSLPGLCKGNGQEIKDRKE